MNKIIAKLPINPTSLGNVSVNLLREFYKKEIEVALFPVSENIDLSVYDKLDKDFIDWINESSKNRYRSLDREIPCFQVWHIYGSEHRISDKSFLYTFYELDQPTFSENKICQNHDKVFFSSSHAKEVFNLNNTSFVPLGFDEDLFDQDVKKNKDEVIHFGLMGKLEKRKNTIEIIKNWLKRFGNNSKYLLSCVINNNFIPNQVYDEIIKNITDNFKYENINFIPFLKTNSEVNDFLNQIDIDLTGLSGGEGWNLPAFNATCLGKWSCVLNNTSHKDWASKENSCLIEPSDKAEAYDGLFFQKGSEFNQGNINLFNEKSFENSVLTAISKRLTKNEEGLKLAQKFSYEKTAEAILSEIF